MATFQEKPAFVEYLELLKQLHVLIDTGLVESREAGRKERDRMDEPWKHLTERRNRGDRPVVGRTQTAEVQSS